MFCIIIRSETFQTTIVYVQNITHLFTFHTFLFSDEQFLIQ